MKDFQKNELDELLKNLKRENKNFIFMNTNNVTRAYQGIQKRLEIIFPDYNIYKEAIEKTIFQSPFNPVLKILKDKLGCDSDLLDKNIYYFHKPIFKSYFKTGIARRDESPIVDYAHNGIDFEKNKMKESINNMIRSSFQDGKYVFLIKNLNNGSSSLFDLLIEFFNEKKNIDGDIIFIFIFNEGIKVDLNSRRERWFNFFDTISERDLIADIIYDDSEFLEKEKNDIDFDNIENLIDKIENNLNFLALEDAKDSLDKITDRVMSGNIDISLEYRFKFLRLQGTLNNYLDENDISLDWYKQYEILALTENDIYRQQFVSNKISNLYLKIFNESEALKFAKRAYKLGEKLSLDDELIEAKSNILKCKKNSNTRKELASSLKKFESLIVEFKKRGYHNNVIYNYLALAGEDFEKKMYYCNRGIEEAKKYGNENFLSRLYHAKGVAYSRLGDKEKEFEYYQKSKELKLKYGNPLEIIRITNAIGYKYFYIGEYEDAINTYKSTFKYLDKIENYKEVAGTFYNIGLAYTFALKYKEGLKYFTKCILLLDKLDITIPYHSKFGINSLILLCDIKLGNKIAAIENMNRLKREYSEIINPEERYYYKISQAEYLHLRGKDKKAKKIYKYLLENITLEVYHKYVLPLIYYEYVKFLNNIGDVDFANKIAEKGIKISKKLNDKTYEEFIKVAIGKSDKIKDMDIKKDDFNIDIILDHIKQKKLMDDIYQRMNDINFMKGLEDILLETNENLDNLIKNISNLIERTFPVDILSFYILNEGEANLKYITDISYKDSFENILKSIDRSKKILDLDNKCGKFNSYINIPLIDEKKLEGNIIIGNFSEDLKLSQEIFKILSISSVQISSTLKRRELEKKINIQNDRLKKINFNMKNLLNNSGEGFLSFGPDLTVQPGYSLECKKILGDNILGKNILKLLFKGDKFKELEELIKNIFNSNSKVRRRGYIRLLPDMRKVNYRDIKIDYTFITQSKKDESKIMVILNDITEKVTLENRFKEKANILEMIVKIVNKKKFFKKFLKQYTIFYKEVFPSLLDAEDINESLKLIFQSIHSYKGNFGQLGMENTEKYLHKIEDIIVDIQDRVNNLSVSEIKSELSDLNLEIAFKKDITKIKDILGEKFVSKSELIEVKYNDILDILKRLKKDYPGIEETLIYHKISNLKDISLKEVILSYRDYIENLSMRKKQYETHLKVIGDDILVDPKKYNSLIDSLIHIFKNAVDHGLESAEIRFKSGKDLKGTILCELEERENHIIIMISDDGKGIECLKIKEKAIKSNLCEKKDLNKMSEQDILKLIFKDNFSTSKSINLISGRGIGLSTVKKIVEDLKGSIKIKTEIGIGTKFILKIPK